MPDSYTINFTDGSKPVVHVNNACFGSVTNVATSKTLENVVVLVENEKLKEFSEEYINTFLDNINSIGGIPVEIEKVEIGYNLTIVPRSRVDSLYITTAIRCLYDRYRNDEWWYVGKHFVNLCNYYPEMDRGLAFTLANQIYCYNNSQKLGPGSRCYFNNNHSIMGRTDGCKLLTTEEIEKYLASKDSLHSIFTAGKIEEKHKYILQEDSKEEYDKIVL